MRRTFWPVFVSASATSETIGQTGRTWFAAHHMNLVLSGWPDWCWHFYCHLVTVHYLCCLWFSDRKLRLNIPHGCQRWGLGSWLQRRGSVDSSADFWWLSRIIKTSLLLSSDLQSYRCPPDAAGSLHCPLHVTHWRWSIHSGERGWNCFDGVRVKCNLVVCGRK